MKSLSCHSEVIEWIKQIIKKRMESELNYSDKIYLLNKKYDCAMWNVK